MNPITSPTSPAPVAYGALPESRSLQAEQTRAGSISQQQNTDLTITTDEGDKVTISLASAMDATAGIYRSLTSQDGYRAASQTAFFEYSSSRSLSVEIEGELSEEEREDIREAVKTIGSMIDDFLSGDLKQMAEDGQLLKELDSIASLDANFSYERQVVYAEQEKTAIHNEAPERHHHARRHGHGRLQRLMNRIDRLTDDMAEQVKHFQGRRKYLDRSVEELLGRYRSGEAENAPTDELGQAAIQTVQSAFVQKIETWTESVDFNLTYMA